MGRGIFGSSHVRQMRGSRRCSCWVRVRVRCPASADRSRLSQVRLQHPVSMRGWRRSYESFNRLRVRDLGNWRRHSRGRSRCRVWLRCPVCLTAPVALEFPLLNKLPGFGSDGTVMPVGELSLLSMVDGPPFRADVDPTADAHPLTRLAGCSL